MPTAVIDLSEYVERLRITALSGDEPAASVARRAITYLEGSKTIIGVVTDVLVEALGVDETEVRPEVTLVGDLGAESIDFPDIIFRAEIAFGIQLSRSELFPEDILMDGQYVRERRLTATGLAVLRERLPYIDLARFEQNPIIDDFGNILTVDDLCRYIAAKIAPD